MTYLCVCGCGSICAFGAGVCRRRGCSRCGHSTSRSITTWLRDGRTGNESGGEEKRGGSRETHFGEENVRGESEMIKSLGKLWPSQTYSVFWPFESQQRKRLYMDLSASWPLLASFSGGSELVDASALVTRLFRSENVPVSPTSAWQGQRSFWLGGLSGC